MSVEVDTDTEVSIGQIKRDISELVNRVAYGHERIVLTSRGRPKAALVSIADYETLRAARAEAGVAERMAKLDEWFARSDRLNERVLKENGGHPIDVDRAIREAREDLEARDDRYFEDYRSR